MHWHKAHVGCCTLLTHWIARAFAGHDRCLVRRTARSECERVDHVDLAHGTTVSDYILTRFGIRYDATSQPLRGQRLTMM